VVTASLTAEDIGVNHHDVEAVLLEHPQIRRCVVVLVDTKRFGETPIAYVETDEVTQEQISLFLAESGLSADSLPRLVVTLRALPLAPSGEVDRAALPLPPSSTVMFGKSDHPEPNPWRFVARLILIAVLFCVPIAVTDLLWPGSTDVSAVPSPWSWLFRGLYLAEWLSFGVGAVFLFHGRGAVARFGRGPVWTTLAHLAIVWLLVAWWPQDNFYRLASKTDWAQQAALVYAFNITLMLAAAILVAFTITSRRTD
jgi:hypothetical protein